ncbi:MAG: prolyl oligopeptidase family serine peptidase, partial [Thermoanaerobaculia bacterium]|nr:prolyl oligopeptidase family serine peptidase [Thermoanaerobaculia bacterium]
MHTTGIRNLRRLRQRRVVAFVLAAAVAAAPVAALELAELLAAPFPSDLVASPAGDRIAWVFNRTGTRGIWTAASPEWEGEELVAGGGDDGQEIGDLAWSADGASLAFVRGGAPNAAGELPNPLSVATGVTRAVFVVDLESGEERRVDDGSSPLFRGDGALLYLKDGDLWVADGDGGAGERLLSVRGRLGQLELSPDDSLVAFVSDRGTHSFVGVYDFAAGNVEWVDPGLDRDAYPSWSPGGARLAFVRQAPRLDAILFEPQRETDLPWSIRVATLGSDGSWAGTEAWRAEAGPGSVYRPVVGNRQLFWLGDDNIAFPWEKTGWNHLWRLSFSSGEAVPQAQGEAEVEYAFQEEPGGEVLFSSNALDVHRRHIWRLKGAAAGVSHLTRGQGIEQAAVPLAGEDFAFLASDARRPLHVQISVGGERREVVPSAIAGFPVTELVEPRIVTITAEDGLEVPAQLFEPKGASTAPRPALLYLHGGSRRQMLPAWHYSAYYHNCYALHQFMVSKGYVVLSLNYRSGIGYGLDFREAEAFGATGASELRDVLAAGRYLASYPDVDPERVGIWGG